MPCICFDGRYTNDKNIKDAFVAIVMVFMISVDVGNMDFIISLKITLFYARMMIYGRIEIIS